MKHKKGFTLIEMLAVVTIIGISTLLIAPSIVNMLKKSEKEQYQNYLDDLYLATKTYITNNVNSFPELQNVGGIAVVDIGTLRENHLVKKKLIDPKTKQMVSDNQQIKITTKEDYIYQYELVTGNSTYNSLGYVSNGLLVFYDGIKNDGIDNPHNSGASTWKNLAKSEPNGILHGTPVWNENSLRFDGFNDYVSFPNPLYKGIGSSSPITMEVIYENTDENRFGVIVSAPAETNYRSFLSLMSIKDDETRTLDIYFSTNSPTQYIRVTPAELPYNVKTAVSYGMDKTNYFAYLNGKEKYNQGIQQILGYQYDNILIGKDHVAYISGEPSNDRNVFFGGNIYAFRIYNRRLTEAEITNNYNIDKTRFGL